MSDYHRELAKIRSARLGWEDHGIFTCSLDLDYGGAGQGTPGYTLDEPRHDAEGVFLGRFGTAFGMEFVIRVMRACGVQDWSDLPGRTIYALKDKAGYGGFVKGIENVAFEKGERFIFDELRDEFPELTKVSA